MDAQAIITKIVQDAKDAAQKVQADAEAKAKLMKLEAEARIEAQEKTMLRQAAQDGDQMEERMKRMADLDDRKAMLQLKREVIDSAFQKAMELLSSTKPADQRAFYLAQVAKLANGEETLIAGADAEYFDDGFLADANKALEKAGKPGKLQMQAQRRKGSAGVVLSQNGAEVRITFDTLLDEARADMEQIAARTLFTE